MPPIEERDLWQTAVLWPFAGYDSYGQPVVGEPVEIAVRWLTKRVKRLDPQGNTVMLDGRAVVRQEVPIDSRMWLGTISGFYGPSGTGSQLDDDEVMEVKTFDSTPDLKGRFTRRECGLMRFRQRQ